jgi:hypothetical protein
MLGAGEQQPGGARAGRLLLVQTGSTATAPTSARLATGATAPGACWSCAALLRGHDASPVQLVAVQIWWGGLKSSDSTAASCVLGVGGEVTSDDELPFRRRAQNGAIGQRHSRA